MTRKRMATLIQEEVQQPTKSTKPSSALAKPPHQEIATTQTTQLTELQITSQGLFDESKALWEEFVAFDKEHQLTQRVGAQLWRLAKAVGKPALVLTLKGIQAAVLTVADADRRTALVERFSRFSADKETDAALEETGD